MTGQPVTRVKVWDGWVRLGHWLIVGLLCLSYWSIETGRMQTHFWSGYAVLALVLFRIVWGFVGSETARFATFLRAPAAALAHLRHFTRREPDTEVGHNAAGGWMVMVMLALLLAQPLTGLFADTGYGDAGPLAKRVASETSDWLTGQHHRIFRLILLAAGLHVLAVIGYAVLKRQDLVRPMLSGVKRLPAGTAAPRIASPTLAAILLAAAVLLVCGISRMG